MNDCITLLVGAVIGAWVTYLCDRVPGFLDTLFGPLISALGVH